MSNDTALESGVVLGFGGTNARFGIAEDGDILRFDSVSTPDKPREFFGWMAHQVLNAADEGHSWMVAGFPGPVTIDGRLVGPMANVQGLSSQQYNLKEELIAANNDTLGIFDQGFQIVAVNDGELAAQSAAVSVGEGKYAKTAALIIGTGVGAGIVNKDPSSEGAIYRADSNPSEIGHNLLSSDPADTVENHISGSALERDYGIDASELPEDHPAWERVGVMVGILASSLGNAYAVELVVPCGGVGSGASDKYWPHLQKMLESLKRYGNGTQKLFLPEVVPVPADEAQTFELFGGEAVMRDFATRVA